MKSLFKFLWWVLKIKWWLIPIIGGIATLLLYKAYYTHYELWWHKMEMPVVFGTFLFSLFIALRTFYEEWDRKLPKRLTVHFKLHDERNSENGKYIMSCHDAYLASEADIRQWGQQIGRQMANELDFEVFIDSTKPKRINGLYNHYSATFFLTKIPKQKDKTTPDLNSKYWVWIVQHLQTPETKKAVFDSHPNHPYSKEAVLKQANKISFQNIVFTGKKSSKDLVTFNIKQEEKFTLLSFSLAENVQPAILFTLTPPDPIVNNFAHKGVILSGRGPIWLYCYLCHFYHPTKFVATYDPRLQGAVVVESHGSEYKVGDIIPVESSLITSNS